MGVRLEWLLEWIVWNVIVIMCDTSLWFIVNGYHCLCMNIKFGVHLICVWYSWLNVLCGVFIFNDNPTCRCISNYVYQTYVGVSKQFLNEKHFAHGRTVFIKKPFKNSNQIAKNNFSLLNLYHFASLNIQVGVRKDFNDDYFSMRQN